MTSTTPRRHSARSKEENYERTLIFDVETTGLPQKTSDINKQPYIIQISFIVINVFKENTVSYETVVEYNEYIRINDSIEVSPKIVEITGITKEKCVRDGVPITNALCKFYKEYMKADRIVSHNIDFDSKMILFEIERNYNNLTRMGCEVPFAIFNRMFNKINNISIYCTMMEGRDVANIVIAYKQSNVSTVSATPLPRQARTYKKNPKLIELYTHLYPEREQPVGLHDSLVDTKVCIDCYIKLQQPTFTKLERLGCGGEEKEEGI